MLSELDATAPEVETEFSNLYPSPLLSQEDRQAPVQIPANSLGAAFLHVCPLPGPSCHQGLTLPSCWLHGLRSTERIQMREAKHSIEDRVTLLQRNVK